MKLLQKSILLMSCLLLTLTSCAKTDEVHTGTSGNPMQNPVSGSEVSQIIEDKETALAIVGDLNSENYDLLLETVTATCDEKEINLYVLDVTDESNSAWLSENEIAADMNVLVIHNGHYGIIDLLYEEEYQSEILNSIIDGIIAQIDATY